MDKSKLKSFAIWARRELIKDVTYKAGLIGIIEDEIKEPVYKTNELQMFDIGTNDPYTIKGEEIKQRNSLVTKVKEKGFNQVVEEIAYTWFNRIIAIRYMEVNDYLPTKVRVLSSETAGKVEPDMVTVAPNIEFAFTDNEKLEVIPTFRHENKLDDLFKMLFIKQCNELHKVLPELFEKTNDFTELLLNVSFTNEDSVVRKLIEDVSEDDFTDQVEIIGWMYQYYNTEPKAKVDAYNGKKKVPKEDIPAKTQLFTPDWVVRYMVENSVGRLWYEGHQNDSLKSEWKYYIDEPEQEDEVVNQLKKIRNEYKLINPEDIKILDPCMGSGHILVYAFEILMQIYTSCGYTTRDAAGMIIEKNLYGADIDDRAHQLAYFAVMMKGRKYDRRFLTKGIMPNLCAIQESNGLNSFDEGAEQFEFDDLHKENSNYLIKLFKDAKEFGSILTVEERNYETLSAYINKLQKDGVNDIFMSLWLTSISDVIPSLINQASILSRKYDVVITNPPYFSGSDMSPKLSEYVKKTYPISKSDMFAVFIEKCIKLSKINGFISLITMQSWMFLSSYEKLRQKLDNVNLVNMVHLGSRAFDEISGEVVQTTTFVYRKKMIKEYDSTFIRLVGINGESNKRNKFLSSLYSQENLYVSKQLNFEKIPGSPIAYWVSEKTLKSFENNLLIDFAYPKQGFATGDNDRFLRLWFETEFTNIILNCSSSDESKITEQKWYPCNKGGSFRRWYGNHNFIANWKNDGYEMKDFKGSVIRNPQFYYNEGMTWSTISSGKLSMRYSPKGFVFETKGSVCFPKSYHNLNYLLGLMNSEIVGKLLLVLSPTLDYHEGPLGKVPVIIDNNLKDEIDCIVEHNISISKIDWDSFESSWDFVKHPLLNGNSIQSVFENWENECNNRFNTLKASEEELNRIFIEIYGLQDELTPEVEDKHVTVNKADLTRDIKSFVSYAVGCIFGRYSLDVDGLAYAGGNWDVSKYTSFFPDKDNCIPITDEEYFEDDIVGRLVDFVRVIYGQEILEENLDFIADALGGKGDTSREIIRNYFIKDFFKDHLKTYKKRPIYWQFDSGKENGFKALIYMHRYNEDTVGTVRTEYLHKLQKVYESEINRMNLVNESSSNATEKARAIKRKEKLTKQLNETNAYDAALSHIALQRIPIDLDDGVKVNYAKFQDIEVSKGDGKKAVKVNLLSKI